MVQKPPTYLGSAKSSIRGGGWVAQGEHLDVLHHSSSQPEGGDDS